MNTYAAGFEYKPLRRIDKSDLWRMTARLRDVFGEGWAFRPEAVSEGGILISDWPGRLPPMYKSMRLSESETWPFADSDWASAWEHDCSEVMPAAHPSVLERPRKGWRTTFLKAFRDAPSWTPEELLKLAAVLVEFGILSRKMPAPARLLPVPD